MKKIILKVCVLGLIAAVITTGCGKKDGEVSKIKKNSYTASEQIEKEYYTIELYQFKDSKSLDKEYKEQVDYAKERGTDSDIKVIVENDNMYEAIITCEPNEWNPTLSETAYNYVLFVKKGNDYVVIHNSSDKSDKEYMKTVGKQFKEFIDKNSSLKDAFNDFIDENKLNTTTDVYDKEGLNDSGCVNAISASNANLISYTGVNETVEKIELEKIKLTDEKNQIFLVAKSSSNTIWTLDLGQTEAGIKLDDCYYVYKSSKYFYLGYNGIVEKRDLQTGKVVWTSEMQIGWSVDNIIETENTLFVFTSEGKETITLINPKDGKPIYDYLNISKYLKSEKIEDDYYDIDPKSAKLEGNILTVKVTDDGNPSDIYEDNRDYKIEIMGYLKINVNNYEVKFEKVK